MSTELAVIRTFVTSVRRTEQITRGVRQLTFGGGDLTSFIPAAGGRVPVCAGPTARPQRVDHRRKLHVGAVRHDVP